MARYQIRTPDNEVIEDFIQTLAEKSWGILKAWKVFKTEPDEADFVIYRQSISLYMVPLVRAYRLCGYSNICLDGAHNIEWAIPGRPRDAMPNDFIYHLFPASGLEEFLDSFSAAAIESVERLILSDLLKQVQSLIKTSFRVILGEYLYFNPLCGKTELCICSSSAPQKVWGKQR